MLSLPETAALLDAMRGTARLMATLIYGGGLRLSECCELRVKDLDFDQGLVFVRGGKGDTDRATLLAESGRDDLQAHLRQSSALHDADRRAGLAGVWLPDALERKYPNAGRELGWFWVFPSHTLSTDPRSGIVRRHHVHASVVQKAVKEAAARAKIHSEGPARSAARLQAVTRSHGTLSRCTQVSGRPRNRFVRSSSPAHQTLIGSARSTETHDANSIPCRSRPVPPRPRRRHAGR